jgi:superfamily I DNA/RNA helicase
MRASTAAQEAVIKSPLERAISLAAPGSGKTHTLAHRIASLIKDQGVKPEEVLIFSYTNDAAGEIRSRVSKLLNNNQEVLDKLYCGTLHSFCYNECLNYTEVKESRVISDFESMYLYEMQLTREILNGKHDAVLSGDIELFKKTIHDLVEAIRKSEKSVSIFENYLSIDKIVNAINKDKDVRDRIAVRREQGTEDAIQSLVIDNILSIMVAEGVYTFPTMILLYNRIISDPEHTFYTKDRLRTFKYISVDEFQDLKDEELEVIHKMSAVIGGSIFCGDIAQSIYSEDYRSLTNLLKTKEYKIYNLGICFRMNRIITDLSNTLRNVIYGRLSGFSSLLDGKDAENFNQSRVVETAKHQRGENIQVHLWSADDHASTFSMMGRFINNLEQEGTKAVISPTNKEARSMWQVLKRSNKKKELSTEFRFFGSEKNFHALLNIALLIITRLFTEKTYHTLHSNKLIRLAADKCISNDWGSYNYQTNGKQKWAKLAYGQLFNSIISELAMTGGIILVDTTIDKMVNRTIYQTPNIFSNHPNRKAVHQTLMPNLLDREENRINAFLFTRGELERGETYFSSLANIYNTMEQIWNQKKDIPTIDKLIADIAALRKINISKSDGKSLAEAVSKTVVNHLNRLAGGSFHPNKFMIKKEKLDQNAKLYVDTMHSSKGLEFDNVHMVVGVGASTSWRWGANLANCLAYVAMTRAKDNLHIHLWDTQLLISNTQIWNNTKEYTNILGGYVRGNFFMKELFKDSSALKKMEFYYNGLPVRFKDEIQQSPGV